MLGLAIESGAIFHAQSQRRSDVVFDSALRQQTVRALEALRALVSAGQIPAAELKPQCDGCSLHEICLPEAAGRCAVRLFEPRPL